MLLDLFYSNTPVSFTLKNFLHFLSFFFVGYHDSVIHSVNPYIAVHFNPTIDFYFKPIIEHNLHHITQEDYYICLILGIIFDRKVKEAKMMLLRKKLQYTSKMIHLKEIIELLLQTWLTEFSIILNYLFLKISY